ncbi:hypothetical protein AN478_00110 [Thiohalorhabdus denitrificans]|uniref:YD repeat-containing protein n=1 Tax=Thiohalorhabdus denitrificans TaxID=381306 RepID=A0A0P9ET61_9GAMM|nr:hypothetical protein [Thiohalorhabdus denitrificans]KPV41937.1 hypothetical protein AN478_00110 [Thiohalorhabdus denitrificans]SCY66194.1 YD repeat-containing protein [Thiohalorhabdus denitrificans]
MFKPPPVPVSFLACLAIGAFAPSAQAVPDSGSLPTFEVTEINMGHYVPTAINDRGRVAGNFYDGYSSAAVWQEGAGFLDETPLPPYSGAGEEALYRTRVFDINNQGTLAGWSDGRRGEGINPVIWDAAGNVTDLGALPGATQDLGETTVITEDGTAYGETYDAAGQLTNFRWTEETGMTPWGDTPEETAADRSPTEQWIRQVLANNRLGELVDPGAMPEIPLAPRFRPTAAEYFDQIHIEDINSNGQIVAWRDALASPWRRAFLLTPRENNAPKQIPATPPLALMVAGAVLLAARRRAA